MGRMRQWEREENEKKEDAFAGVNKRYLKLSRVIKKETIISEERNTVIITSIQSNPMTPAFFFSSQPDPVQRHSLFLYLVQLSFSHPHLSLITFFLHLQDIHMM
jgi:hypothetical protein